MCLHAPLVPVQLRERKRREISVGSENGITSVFPFLRVEFRLACVPDARKERWREEGGKFRRIERVRQEIPSSYSSPFDPLRIFREGEGIPLPWFFAFRFSPLYFLPELWIPHPFSPSSESISFHFCPCFVKQTFLSLSLVGEYLERPFPRSELT